MKLLFVEDDIEMSELLTEILNKENNYRNLIFSLLTFPQRAELILNSNQQLLDTGLIQMIDQVATRMAANSSTEAASFLRNVAAQLRVNYATANRVVDNIYQAELKLPDLRQLAKKVKRLGESSQKISQVVNLINSFADRTNLLALNAFLEANRAGQEGQNLAIVAEEVQTMAKQSAEATTEIEKLVASIQLNIKEVVTAMELGTEQVVAGTKLVDETRQKLNQIADSSALVGSPQENYNGLE